VKNQSKSKKLFLVRDEMEEKDKKGAERKIKISGKWSKVNSFSENSCVKLLEKIYVSQTSK